MWISLKASSRDEKATGAAGKGSTEMKWNPHHSCTKRRPGPLPGADPPTDRHTGLASSHTHGGPKVLQLHDPFVDDRTWPADDPYLTWLEERIVAGTEEASARLEPVRISVGAGGVYSATGLRVGGSSETSRMKRPFFTSEPFSQRQV